MASLDKSTHNTYGLSMGREQPSPPPRWIAHFAVYAGLLCIGLGVWSWVELRDARLELADAQARALADIVDQSRLLENSKSQGEIGGGTTLSQDWNSIQKSLKGRQRTWEMRRLGLFIAGIVLLFGGYIAIGIRRLYDKMDWYEHNSDVFA